MRIDTTFLRSKVGRRIFLLFVLCALLPIAVLAVLSIWQVTKELDRENRIRLRRETKATGLALYERLLFLEGQLRVIAVYAFAPAAGAGSITPVGFGEDPSTGFVGLAVFKDAGESVSLFGRIEYSPRPTVAEMEYLRAGHTLLSSQTSPNAPARIFMSRLLDLEKPTRGMLVGEISTTFLWDMGGEDSLPYLTKVCVLDQSSTPMFCSPDFSPPFHAQAVRRIAASAVGQFEWNDDGGEHLASYWSLPLQAKFGVPKWIIALSKSKADMFAPMADFTRSFFLVVLMSLWVVVLLSVSQIRRSLVPLEKLREGTERVAKRDFETRVTVTSGDEFEELATSFNSMANHLGRQFHALSAMGAIDRAILASLDPTRIVDTVLTRMRDVLPCDCVCVILRDAVAASVARAYVRDGGAGARIQEEDIRILPEEIQRLRENTESLLLLGGDLPLYLAPLTGRGITSAVVLPVFLKERVSAMIVLGHRAPYAHSREDVLQARRLANQVGVALSNAHLIEELASLNWGTLTALARAIDAKSAWTAGHSERVTDLALRIGWVLGLGQAELDILHRGGLLHDIGKIGIPPEILDKAGRLGAEEVQVMRRHVRIGVRILEPIAAYAEVMPIVLQHHEWFDGNGYPDGLAGEAISLGARIFAVADSYDALISDRPYRRGLDRRRAVEIIKEGIGRQFDPMVVRAFLTLLEREERVSPNQKESARALPVPRE